MISEREPVPSWLFLKKFTFFLLLISSLSILILLAVWPWPLYFFHGFARHWDPPLHIWKLSWNIKHILSGKILLPAFNANSFYPHAYTLCFHDLYWIPSWFASIVYKIYPNKIFTYNTTFLAMWVFSGLCMYLLLRELNLSKTASFFGAAAFCLAPYRTSYYMEFNMQLCFGVPLIFLFLLRFIKSPSWINSLGFALSFWAQAVSALYYAVIVACLLPFFLLPWWKTIVTRLKEKEFYLYLAIIFIVGAGLGGIYLWPYIVLKHTSHLYRSLGEVNLHSAQPLAYFLIKHHGVRVFRHLVILPPENVIFPGFTLLALSILFFWIHHKSVQITQKKLIYRSFSWIRLLALLIFFLLCIRYSLQISSYKHPHASLFLNATLILFLLCSLIVTIGWVPSDHRMKFVSGLACISCVAFVLSLGPYIKTGHYHVMAYNYFYLLFYKFSYIIKSMRVVSRFSFIILTFIIITASVSIHELTRKPWLKFLIIPIIGLIFLESHVMKYRYWTQPETLLSPKLASVLDTHTPTSIIVLPIGDRRDDGRYMMSVAGSKYLLVNGWDAFYPMYAIKLAHLFSDGNLTEALGLLKRLWPAPYVLVDLKRLDQLRKRGYGTSNALIKNRCLFITKDKMFSLYKLKDNTLPTNHYIRYTRLDFIRHANSIIFKAKLSQPLDGTILPSHPDQIAVKLNQHLLKVIELHNTWTLFTITINHRIRLKPDMNIFSFEPVHPETYSFYIHDFQLNPTYNP